MNSYEGYKKENPKMKDDKNCHNAYEIEKAQIIIGKIPIGFSYNYTFDEEGTYEIKYLFKNKLTKLNHMLYNCSSITKLNLSKFDTHYVTRMESMFYGCQSLEELNLSNFRTPKVTDMGGMFFGCSKLTNLDIRNFNTNLITNM